MVGRLLIDDIDCTSNYNVYVSDVDIYRSAKREVEFYNIPGRNGDLTVDKGTFENITVRYGAFIANDFLDNIDDFRNFTSSLSGYHKIEDSFFQNEFRRGVFSTLEISKTADGEIGTFDIIFNCKPQRYLKSGENASEYISGDTLENPTLFASKPLIRAYGAGILSIGRATLTIAEHDFPYIDIDCEMQDCFYEASNCNNLVTLSSGNFPELQPGVNAIEFEGDSVMITPRWWKL